MRTLLLVDPDQLLRWSLETHLRQWFTVISAASRKTALAALARDRFDVLIHCTDPDPLMGKLEESARKHNPEVQIVRLTTGDRSVVADPTVACLEKPFRLEALAYILGVCEIDAGEKRDVR